MGCPWFSSFCNLARLFLSHAKVTIHDPNTGRAAAVAYIDGRFWVGAVHRRRGEEGKSGTEGEGGNLASSVGSGTHGMGQTGRLN